MKQKIFLGLNSQFPSDDGEIVWNLELPSLSVTFREWYKESELDFPFSKVQFQLKNY